MPKEVIIKTDILIINILKTFLCTMSIKVGTEVRLETFTNQISRQFKLSVKDKMEATSGEPISSRNEIYKIENLSPITPILDTEEYTSGPEPCFELSFIGSTQGIIPIDKCVVVLQEYDNCDIQFPYFGLYCMRHVYVSAEASSKIGEESITSQVTPACNTTGYTSPLIPSISASTSLISRQPTGRWYISPTVETREGDATSNELASPTDHNKIYEVINFSPVSSVPSINNYFYTSLAGTIPSQELQYLPGTPEEIGPNENDFQYYYTGSFHEEHEIQLCEDDLWSSEYILLENRHNTAISLQQFAENLYLGSAPLLWNSSNAECEARESLSADNQNLVPMIWLPFNYHQTLHLESTQCEIVSSPVRVHRTPSDSPPSKVIMSIREFIIASGSPSREDGNPTRGPGTPPARGPKTAPGSPPSETNGTSTPITSQSELCEEPFLDSSEWSGSGRIRTRALNNSDAEPGEYRQPYEPFVQSKAKLIPYQSGPRYPLRYRSIFHSRVNVKGLEYLATPLTGRTCNRLNCIRKRIDFDMEEH